MAVTCARMGRAGLAALLAGAALALATGSALRTPVGLALVALAFGGFQLTIVLADARLQARADDRHRATLTSVAGLGTDVARVAVYGAYAVVSSAAAHGTAFAWAALPYLVTALTVAVGGGTSAR